MKTCHKGWIIITLFGFFHITLFFANTIQALAAEYRYIESRKPFRFVNGSVGINNNGVVFGSHDFGLIKLSIPSLPSTGFIYNGLTYTELLPIGGRGAAITDMNDSGAAVGYSVDFNWRSQGFLYKHGIYTKVTPQGSLSAITRDINNSEAVIVNGYDSGGIKGFLYSDGIYTELLPPGCTISYAVKSNDNGTIIVNGSDGTVEDNGTEKYFAFLLKDGVYTKLLPEGWTSSEAQDINETGQVLCSGTDPTGREMVFTYQEGMLPQVLEKCENPGGLVFMDINDSGVVICNSNLYGPGMYKDGIYTKVLPEGWNGAYLMKINNNGEIIGYSSESVFVYKDGNYIELGKGWYEPIPYDINDKGVIVGTFQDTCCVDSFPRLYPYLCKTNFFTAIPQ